MEKVFVYGFPGFFVSLWLFVGLRGKGSPGLGAWMLQLVPAVLVEGIILLDEYMSAGGIPAPLLAADLLFLDAVVLQMTGFQPGTRVFTAVTVILASAGLARSVIELTGQTVPLGSVTFMTLCSSMLLLYTVLSYVYILFNTERTRNLASDCHTIHEGRSICALGLALAGIVILVACPYDDVLSRIVSLLVSLLLVVLYMYLQVRASLGPAALKAMSFPTKGVSGHQRTEPERVMDESKRIDILFERVEEYMQKEKPYLDDMFSLSGLAMEMMTNKSMLSKTINEKAGKNFCQYVNSYRIKHAVALIKRDRRLKVGELSLMSGFHTVASFNMAFKLFMNDTPSEYMRTLYSEGLARKRAGEQ